MTPRLIVDELVAEVRWSTRRKTLGLTVDREGELIVYAPEGCERSMLESFIREKRLWAYTKLAKKQAIRKPLRPKEYVNGEGFYYLGRSYRLRLVDTQDVPLKLDHGSFKLLRLEADSGKAHFIRWYKERGRAWLASRTARLAERVGVNPGGVQVRNLGNRWGSCGKGDTLYFHWATILLPPSIAEYVLVHELVHLREPHHTPEFWQRVERVLPDLAERRRWLAENGSAMVLL